MTGGAGRPFLVGAGSGVPAMIRASCAAAQAFASARVSRVALIDTPFMRTIARQLLPRLLNVAMMNSPHRSVIASGRRSAKVHHNHGAGLSGRQPIEITEKNLREGGRQ